jgi:hypothetical protein
VYSGPVGGRAHVFRDADLQFQLANQLVDENRLQEALRSFDRATQTDDIRPGDAGAQGKIRTALRVAEFGLARQEAEKLTGSSDARRRCTVAAGRRAVVERPVR